MKNLVSIIMPTFNSELYLEQAVRSLLRQSYANFELILVDDGSSDGTLAMHQGFKDMDSRVHSYKRPENYFPGGNGARKYGFEQAKGDLIKFFDSDDYMLEHCIEKQCDILGENQNVDVVFSSCIVKDAELNLTIKDKWREKHDSDNRMRDYLLGSLSWPTPSGLWRNPSLQRLNPFDENISNSQEWFLHFKALLLGLNIKTDPEVLYWVRQNAKGISRNRGRSYWLNKILSRRKAFSLAISRFNITASTTLLKEMLLIGKNQKILLKAYTWRTILLGRIE